MPRATQHAGCAAFRRKALRSLMVLLVVGKASNGRLHRVNLETSFCRTNPV